ncbi:MmgE/PrpD family protein [Chloroflexota bacterium]
MGATEEIASFIVGTGFNEIPEKAVETAKEAILDCLGVTLAGSVDPTAEIITQYVKELGCKPEVSVIGSGFKASPPQAALANGTIAHALDYDDMTIPWIHPSAPVLPAILALGEAGRISGKEAIEAYVLGFEVEVRVGSGIGRRPYLNGWHSTATLGTLGAAAAAAKILKLNVEQTRMALGIAASQAGGFRQNFGSMTKPFHAGNAAKNGVVAAILAKKDFTAALDILEGDFGFCKVMAGEGKYDLNKITQGLGKSFAIVDYGVEVKPYPCCGGTHLCIDAILHLIKQHHLSAEGVDKVKCLTTTALPQVLIHSRPKNGLEGKFSMQYCMATALIDGEVRLKQFADEKVLNPEVKKLIEKVEYVHPDDGTKLQGETVTVRLRDGREYSHQVLIAKGRPGNPLTREELVAKYRDCAGFALSREDTEQSLELVLKLEDLDDITELMNLVGSRTSSG